MARPRNFDRLSPATRRSYIQRGKSLRGWTEAETRAYYENPANNLGILRGHITKSGRPTPEHPKEAERRPGKYEGYRRDTLRRAKEHQRKFENWLQVNDPSAYQRYVRARAIEQLEISTVSELSDYLRVPISELQDFGGNRGNYASSPYPVMRRVNGREVAHHPGWHH